MTTTLLPVRRMRILAYFLAAILVTAVLTAVTTTPAVSAGDPCGPDGNAIACENSKPGSPPSEWDIWGAGDESIQGYPADISVNAGNKIDFKIDTDASAYSITIYRMGYYGGMGARKITTVNPSASLPQNQPQCITEAATELYDCGNWAVSASWNVPADAVSGVYVAKLHRADNDGSSHITFVVRNDSSQSDVVFQTSDTTWQAYNDYGGSNFYHGGANGRSYKLSYNRPVMTRDGIGGRDFFMSNEYPMVRFMEKNGYDVSYISGVDTDRYGERLLDHKVYLSVGHDEYWSGNQRKNVEKARDAGVHLQFLSGNEMYWKTRYEPSADASRTPYRTLVSYKETWADTKLDPDPEWTGTWRDPRFAPKSRGGGMPENGVTGTLYMSNFTDLPITVPAAHGKTRLWRHTELGQQSGDQKAALTPSTIGYESNEDLDNGARPPGLIRLSETVGPTPEYLQDFGSDVAPGTTRHNITLYKAPSGALVFSAGTVQWTWGLDAEHDAPGTPPPADRRMQQAQVNLFADMGVQPTTLDPTLTQATKSTDTTGPTVTINAPAAGSNQANGTRVTVSGTAADSGGGVVAGVEVSTDGATWHPATGTTSWSYTYTQHGVGTNTIRVRAIDDSANIGAAATRSVNVACPCTIFGDGPLPDKASATSSDTSSTEVGIRFTAMADGFVTGVRFYKGQGNDGPHIGSLWSTSGQQLAQASFAGESASGWQTVTFAEPVAVSAGTTYIASYSAPNGRYAVQDDAFYVAGIDADPLSVEGGFGAEPAGVYGAAAGRFPDRTWGSTNYFVDVTFTTTNSSPLVGTNHWPAPSSTSVPTDTEISAKYSKPLTAGTQGITVKDANGATVAGTATYDASTRVITFRPAQPLEGFVKYTVTITGTDTQGEAIASGATWSFTTVKPPSEPGVCPCSLFDDTTLPTQLEDADRDPVNLGVQFTPEVSGTVTGVRFYKGPNNAGPHTGSLWTDSGTRLATGTFTNESETGWQTLTFAQPVPVTAGTPYVASYFAPVARYSATPNAFAAADLSKPPLRVTSDAGRYFYGPDGFPTTPTSASYLVDVVFEKGAPAPISVVSTDPANGAVDVPRGTSIKVALSAPVKPGYTMTVRQGSATITGTAALSADATTITFTPEAALPAGADITVSLSGVSSVEGSTLATQTWSFRTRSADTVSSQTLFSDQVPQSAATSDASPVEVGTVFTPARDGKITAIRFYKGTGNTGTHTGSLWTRSGQRLANVTFTGESSTGWQTANLPSPVSVEAGTSYVVSYFAPRGHYASTPRFFSNPYDAGNDLSAPSGNNGLYVYGAGGGFPTFSWQSTNYFVDVVFEPQAPTMSVANRTPAPDATNVSRGVSPSIDLSAPAAPGWTMSVKAGSTNVAGTANLSADGRRITFTPTGLLPADTLLTVTVSGVVSTEGIPLPTTTWSFRTEPASSTTTLMSLFGNETPATAANSDTAAVEVGTAFTPSVNGQVTAIRFYKGPGNSGTHTGSLWTSTGTRLGMVTFRNETSTGWQTATLTTPVQLTAGQTYVVSYFAPNGRYAVTSKYFVTPKTVGPLTARAGNNGLYRYGAGGGFPTSTYNQSSYFVDVVFRHGTG